MAKIITIPKSLAGKDDLVVLSRGEYEQMKSQMVPITYLEGRVARKVDKRVERALKNYNAGETRQISSLADLD